MYVKTWSVSEMQSLLKSRSMPMSHIDILPSIGLMVISAGKPIAAGFLRKVEGGSALFDSLITDSQVEPDLRNKALDYLVSHLIDLAKVHDIKSIIAFSSDAHTLMRAQRFGFAQQEHSLITLPLF